jgi:hypothetical protein
MTESKVAAEIRPLTEIEKLTMVTPPKEGMTREEWLRHAVEELDAQLFDGDLNILEHGYQIGTGKCGGQKLTECVQPFDGEDVTLEDFFPTTISVSYSIKDPIEMLGALALECIHAFFNEQKASTKRFKALAQKYYFDKPYNSYHPTKYLIDILEETYKIIVKQWGTYPGKPVVIHKNESKEKKKNTYTYTCPNCGWSCKVTKKMYEKYKSTGPVCPCGAHLAVDVEDEITDE